MNRKKSAWCLLCFICLLIIPSSHSSDTNFLEKKHRLLLIDKFKTSDNPKALLEASKTELADLKQKNIKLANNFNNNSKELEKWQSQNSFLLMQASQIETGLKEQAKKIQDLFMSSQISVLNIEQIEFIEKLVRQSASPQTSQLNTFRQSIEKLIDDTKQVARINLPVYQDTGKIAKVPVTLIGPFTAISHGNYLRYYPELKQLGIPFHQPQFYLRLDAESFENSKKDLEIMAIDPSHGDLVKELEQAPTVFERIDKSGIIGMLILILGLSGCFLIILQFIYLSSEQCRFDDQLEKISNPCKNNALGRILRIKGQAISEAPGHHHIHQQDNIKTVMNIEFSRLYRWQPLIKLTSVLVLLLGILGTVHNTMDFSQKHYKNIDYSLIAVNISQGLVPLALGLIFCILLLTGRGIINSKAGRLVKTLKNSYNM